MFNALPLLSRTHLFEVYDGKPKSEFAISDFLLNEDYIYITKIVMDNTAYSKYTDLKVIIYSINGKIISDYIFSTEYLGISKMNLSWDDTENIVKITHKFRILR